MSQIERQRISHPADGARPDQGAVVVGLARPVVGGVVAEPEASVCPHQAGEGMEDKGRPVPVVENQEGERRQGVVVNGRAVKSLGEFLRRQAIADGESAPARVRVGHQQSWVLSALEASDG